MTVPTGLALLVVASKALAVTWQVPGDLATIQAAFDTLSDGDTVIVEAGVYHESLLAPSLDFVCLGVVDSGGNPDRPVVDPSPLPNSTGLACLTLADSSRVVIENLIFRNGPEMFPRMPSNAVGGIVDHASDLVLRHCVWDSTYLGLFLPPDTSGIGTLFVSDCEFAENVDYCLLDRNSAPATVVRTSFSGAADLPVWFCDNTLVENCTFTNILSSSSWMWLIGEGITVRECTFGPSAEPVWSLIYTGLSRGCQIEGNLFHDIEVRNATVFFAGISGDLSEFQRNIFRSCRGVLWPNANGALDMNGQQSIMDVAVSASTFDSCTSWSSDGTGAIAASLADIVQIDNRFIGHDAPAPAVWAFQNEYTDIYNCSFERTGFALRAEGDSTVHAEMNWWNDITGPYHAELNPQGLGDSISGPVDFEPWLTEDPLSAPEIRIPAPSAIDLEVFPNPFNSTAELRLRVDQPGRHTIALYNAIGQYVKELWAGEIMGQKQIMVNGESLPSGLYFVRVRQLRTGQTIAAAKVLLLK